MSTLHSWISQNPTHFDVVAPIKARACGAWQAVRKSKPRRPNPNVRIMQRGAERC
ncbi:MAG TPA: hypothetical protein VME67_19155 [Mycobacterium sp.]|nr:hypothetical protein [Mycobacterium sp.]HTX96784.1 hypothetical protein [Mycobacterium sp.]